MLQRLLSAANLIELPIGWAACTRARGSLNKGLYDMPSMVAMIKWGVYTGSAAYEPMGSRAEVYIAVSSWCSANISATSPSPVHC